MKLDGPDCELIPFNKSYLGKNYRNYLNTVIEKGELSGNQTFTKRSELLLKEHHPSNEVLLTNSCTKALEIAALLLEIKPGDEVILPSFTFVSTANAFLLRGATLKFVDVRSDTLNIDENLIEEHISERTKAIVIVHYAGNACELKSIKEICKKHDLKLVEDAAQAVGSTYHGEPLGTAGDIGCYSFHETKNITSGEGGALSVNNADFVDDAHFIREKGTNRRQFTAGLVDKYTWTALGTHGLQSELGAAILLSQLEELAVITESRRHSWTYYYENLAETSEGFGITLPTLTPNSQHNAHIFYIILPDECDRLKLIQIMRAMNVCVTFHYLGLHKTPFYSSQIRDGDQQLTITEWAARNILRLPLYYGLSQIQQDYVLDALKIAIIGASK